LVRYFYVQRPNLLDYIQAGALPMARLPTVCIPMLAFEVAMGFLYIHELKATVGLEE
jgi:hypothetical protein